MSPVLLPQPHLQEAPGSGAPIAISRLCGPFSVPPSLVRSSTQVLHQRSSHPGTNYLHAAGSCSHFSDLILLDVYAALDPPETTFSFLKASLAWLFDTSPSPYLGGPLLLRLPLPSGTREGQTGPMATILTPSTLLASMISSCPMVLNTLQCL